MLNIIIATVQNHLKGRQQLSFVSTWRNIHQKIAQCTPYNSENLFHSLLSDDDKQTKIQHLPIPTTESNTIIVHSPKCLLINHKNVKKYYFIARHNTFIFVVVNQWRDSKLYRQYKNLRLFEHPSVKAHSYRRLLLTILQIQHLHHLFFSKAICFFFQKR